jgi:hypothetical protein
MSTHGDVLEIVTGWLVSSGVVAESSVRYKKGSTWMVGMDRGLPVDALHLPPPA